MDMRSGRLQAIEGLVAKHGKHALSGMLLSGLSHSGLFEPHPAQPPLTLLALPSMNKQCLVLLPMPTTAAAMHKSCAIPVPDHWAPHQKCAILSSARKCKQHGHDIMLKMCICMADNQELYDSVAWGDEMRARASGCAK
ncbi:hypothetical protein HaLaN_00788 [Haematococcus lacustris]|uniref:Uncharacterized protein n=1 Tax=Haematococcus lacustris TaxID=44745 RepID=A0A699YED8_HAELA|nr:hypothetical protein HaLaN_00788 [Haematococcus lacustris]